jgi:hypothetical protein
VNEEISISVALQVAQRPSVIANSRVLIVRRELMKSEISGDLFVAFIPLFYQVVCYVSSAMVEKFSDRRKSSTDKGLGPWGQSPQMGIPMIGGGGGNRTPVLTSSASGHS